MRPTKPKFWNVRASRLLLMLVNIVLIPVPSLIYARPEPARVPDAERFSRPVGAKVYTISKDYTTLSFTAVKWKVFKEQGFFKDFSGTVSYDPKNPSVCSIQVTAEAVSLDTGNAMRDKVLRSDDFFDAAKYPELSFRSLRITGTKPGSFDVLGDLTIHGITKRITVPVKIIGTQVIPNIGDFVGFETAFNIDRREFGVLGTRWSGNTVAIDPIVLIHLIVGGVRPL